MKRRAWRCQWCLRSRRRTTRCRAKACGGQEGHDCAVLLSSGATAVCPYLLLQIGGSHAKAIEGGAAFDPIGKLLKALDEALKRIMSKMGICSVDGYRGSGLFEAVGIAPEIG